MIQFKVIRYKNFLSTGNIFTEIDLQKNSSTLVLGSNGAGKSTFVDALCFVLFGTAYRKINKPQLINSITKKETLVEIEFTTTGNEYLVRRGIWPELFEVHENGKLINQTASIKEYQESFENAVLKMNKKTFCQIVILGTAGYIPFMQLSAYDRRAIVEDMLDIQIFSKMNVLLKDMISTNKDAVKDCEHAIKLLEQKKELIEKNEALLKQNTEQLIQDQENIIKACIEQRTFLETDIDVLQESISNNEHFIKQYDTLDNKVLSLKQIYVGLQERARPNNKQLEFFKEHDHCPTCSQTIESAFKELKLQELTKKKQELDKGLSIAVAEQKVSNEKLEQLRVNVNKIQDWKQSINDHQLRIKHYNNSITAAESAIKKLRESTPKIDIMESEDINKKLSELNNEKYDLLDKKRIYDIAAVLLKDSGIKTKITKQYIPVINKLINKYLAALDFFVSFELDEQFKEKIKSRFRDEFSYESFSEGEKLRIDLALLFTWRAIAKLRNSASTNLLIMDEIFDSSLDVSGTDEFMKMLREIAQDSNVFVISHKGDALFDKFQHVVRFEKVKNFSRMVA